MRDGARPAAERGPSGEGRGAQDRLRADPPAHLADSRQHEPVERKSEADRRGAVVPPRQQLAWTNEDHRAARRAAVTAQLEHEKNGGGIRADRATHLPLAKAVAVEAKGTPDGVARRPACGTVSGAYCFDRGQLLLPALDIERAVDETMAASIPRHANRSTTRRLSAKTGPPRRLLWLAPRRCSAPTRRPLLHPRAVGKVVMSMIISVGMTECISAA